MKKIASFPLAILAALGTAGAALAEGDAAAGADTYNTICVTCHMEQEGTLAPTLYGIVGREAASDANFPMYTEALKAHEAVWTPEALDEFLASPMTVVPGTAMIFPVADAQQRADLIAYLETLPAQ